jgi:hypothetical protein
MSSVQGTCNREQSSYDVNLWARSREGKHHEDAKERNVSHVGYFEYVEDAYALSFLDASNAHTARSSRPHPRNESGSNSRPHVSTYFNRSPTSDDVSMVFVLST